LVRENRKITAILKNGRSSVSFMKTTEGSVDPVATRRDPVKKRSPKRKKRRNEIFEVNDIAAGVTLLTS
jgi:hypothetical protein